MCHHHCRRRSITARSRQRVQTSRLLKRAPALVTARRRTRASLMQQRASERAGQPEPLSQCSPGILTWQLLQTAACQSMQPARCAPYTCPKSQLHCSTADQTPDPRPLSTSKALGFCLYRVTEPPQVYLIGPSRVPCANWRTMGSLVLSNSSVVPSQTTWPCTHSQDSISTCSLHLKTGMQTLAPQILVHAVR